MTVLKGDPRRASAPARINLPHFSNHGFFTGGTAGGRVRRALALLLGLLALAPLAPAQSPRVVDIEAGSNADGSMYLRPDRVEARLGEALTLRVKNPDRIFHDVALLDYDGEDIEIEVPAGRTVERSFTANVAGEFRLVCEVTGHKQKGMQGVLVVTDPNETPAPALASLLGLVALAALVLRRR